MHWSYSKDSPNWNEEKARILASELGRLLDEILSHPDDNATEGDGPHVEYVPGTGVSIRKITYLPDETKRLLIEESEKVYARVMGIRG